MGSPITSWEGAEAYFTFADKPLMIYALLAAAVVVTVATIVMAAHHENESYKKVGAKP